MHESIKRVRVNMEAAAKRAGRDVSEITLICVSKTKPREQILEAYAAGERHFGESYATEAAAKIESLKDSGLDGVVWHFIGPIQKNKTKIIASYFDVVESVDRQIIAQRLDAQRPPHLPPLDILLQVNISGEAQKSGCSPEALPALVDYVKTCPRLRLRGLMGIAREGAPEEEILTSFTRLRQLFERLHEECGTDILSMGMSGDLESAVKAGATEVRIGTDIFGAREKKQPAETAALAELAQKDKAPRLTLTQGFIGGGNMARAIFAGLLPLSRAALFTVSTPHPEKLSFFREAGAGITSDNRTAAAAQVPVV